MRYVVAYDISNNKRRKKLADLLDGYGMRVNLSVYEIELNQTRYKKLLQEIETQKLCNKKYDSVRFYHICENCLAKSFELSVAPDPFEPTELFV
jgi:CRISPR-associated protein Cas2